MWDRKAHGCHHCCPDIEDGLKVTRSGATHITLLGDGSPAKYYTFEAALNAAGDKMIGNITTGGRKFGTFAAQKDGCPAIVKCTPSKPPPPPPPGPPRPPPPTPGPPGPPPPPPAPHPPVPVWPLPLKLDCTKALDNAPTTLLSTSVAIKLSGSGAASPVAVQAASRYQLLLRAAGSAAGSVKQVMVEVSAADDTLGPATNYSYSLHYAAAAAAADVAGAPAATAIAASAATPFGVGYAMETLLQLASPEAQRSCGAGFSVADTPGYEHRGLLLDTGRRFFPLELLESQIDAMAMFKLNVLHLHLNEDRFRVESKAFPLLNMPQNCSEVIFYRFSIDFYIGVLGTPIDFC